MEISEIEIQSVNGELKKLIQNYLDRHPGLSLNALAARSNVSATTLRRLMNSADKKSDIAPHTVLAIVSYVLKERKISLLLKKVTGPIAELLRRSFDQFIFDDKTSDHQLIGDLNVILKDETNYLIYKLAANKCGTSISEISKLFGINGLNKLSVLMDEGWIIADTENQDRIHAKEKNFSLDLELSHKLSHSLLDLYKPRDVGMGLNLFYSLSEAMTQEGILKIKEIEKLAVKKIFEVMSDETYQGHIPYYTLVMSDVLGPTPKEENNGVLQ